MVLPAPYGRLADAPRRRDDSLAFFISVKTQFENVGDALITRELVSLAAERARTFVDLSRCPRSFRNTMNLSDLEGVTTLNTLGFPRLIATMMSARARGRRCVYLLQPGGRSGELNSMQLARQRLSDYVLRSLRALGIRVWHLGISYDALGTRHVAALRSRVAQLHVHAVRDSITASYLESLGVRVDAVLPDLAVRGFLGRDPLTGSGRHSVAFSFRRDKAPHRVDEVASLVQHVLDHSPGLRRAKFVSQVRRDHEFMLQLLDRAHAPHGVSLEHYECSDSIQACISTYSDCSRIYSNRLHALLIAAMSGAIPIAIVDDTTDVKIVGAFRHLGIADYLVSLGRLDELAEVPDHFDFERMKAAARTLVAGFELLAHPAPAASHA